MVMRSRVVLLVLAAAIAGCTTIGCAGTGRSAAADRAEAPDGGPSASQRTHALATIAALRNRWFQVVTAKLATNTDTALAYRLLDTLLGSPSGDMFWMYPAAATYCYCRDKLSPQWRQRFRRAMKTYSPYRGDTENHFLMYYVTLLLFSQEWPDLTADEWFNGKSSRENNAEATEYLTQWMDHSARYGISEWDSPRYAYFYIGPLLMLHDFAADPQMRGRAGMLIELHLADFATENLNGAYCGAHSRDGDAAVTDPRAVEMTSYEGFYFEDSTAYVLPDLAFAALSRFECPSIIRAIAHDRAAPYTERETRFSRTKIRFASERQSVADKITYMTPDYALGSVDGPQLGPIQQHSWDVTFAARRPNATIFGLHPHYSPEDLGTFFPEEPELMVASVAQTKGNYINENKWLGASPYEHLVQDGPTLVALYDIPASAPFQHVDLFFPKSLDTIEIDAGGWIFCRMGEAFTAVAPLGSGRSDWTEETSNRRLRIAAGTITGYVVECGSTREMTYDAFKERLRAHRPAAGAAPNGAQVPALSVIAPNGDSLAVTGSSFEHLALTRNGAPAWSGTRRLFDGPHLSADLGTGIITLQCGAGRRVLDFERGIVTVRTR